MDYKVFYSWQSDLPNATNRGFIQDALEKAAGIVAKDETVSVAPLVDRDTQGVPGSPEIGATIFSKIDNSQAFVCDVSIINAGIGARPTPNPNVMLELGYAAKSLGWERIVMVMNAAYGAIDDLPFDLRTRRVVPYDAREGEVDRSVEKRKLTGTFEAALRAMVNNLAPAEAAGGVEIPTRGLADIAIEAVEEARPNQALHVRRFTSYMVERLEQIAPDWSTGGEQDEKLIASIEASLPIAIEFAKVIGIIAAMDSAAAAKEVFRAFGPILYHYDVPTGFSGGYQTVDFDFFKFIGHEFFVMFVAALMREDRLDLLADLLDSTLSVSNNQIALNYPHNAFKELSKYVRLLQYRNERLSLRRLSLHADIIYQRHNTGELVAEMPVTDFLAADILLFLRGEIMNDTNDIGIEWIPWSVLYMDSVPQFLVEAERKSYFQRLLPVFGSTDVVRVRTKIEQNKSKLQRLYNQGVWNSPLRVFNPSSIASR